MSFLINGNINIKCLVYTAANILLYWTAVWFVLTVIFYLITNF